MPPLGPHGRAKGGPEGPPAASCRVVLLDFVAPFAAVVKAAGALEENQPPVPRRPHLGIKKQPSGCLQQKPGLAGHNFAIIYFRSFCGSWACMKLANRHNFLRSLVLPSLLFLLRDLLWSRPVLASTAAWAPPANAGLLTAPAPTPRAKLWQPHVTTTPIALLPHTQIQIDAGGMCSRPRPASRPYPELRDYAGSSAATFLSTPPAASSPRG